jgi:hypothetical protein
MHAARRADILARQPLRDVGDRRLIELFHIRLGQMFNARVLMTKLAEQGGVSVDRIDLDVEIWQQAATAVRDQLAGEVTENHKSASALIGFLLEDTEDAPTSPEAS